MRWVRGFGYVVVAMAVVIVVVTAPRLGAHDDGPARIGVGIPAADQEHAIPATLHIPGEVDRDVQALPDPLPVGERPPIVVVAHGFTADRASMQAFAQSLTAAGYVVVSFDFRGHGQNRNRFDHGGDLLIGDVTAAVDYAVNEGHGDPERVAVLGHSMGAGAVLQQASYDGRVSAAIPVSGGYAHSGPETPDRSLFIWASGDPGALIDRAIATADLLESEGGDVVRVEVPGTDHLTILSSEEAVQEIVGFLDGSFGIDRGAAPALVSESGPVALYAVAALVLTLAAARFAARFAPVAERRPVRLVGVGVGLGALFLALLVASPLLAGGAPLGVLRIVLADLFGSLFAIGAGLVLVIRIGQQRGIIGTVGGEVIGGHVVTPNRWPRTVGAALLAFAAAYALLTPLGVVAHNLSFTPERFVVFIGLTAAFLPFAWVFHAVVRRGSPWVAAGVGVVGRIVALAVIAIGLAVGTLPGVVALGVVGIVALFVLLELIAAVIYPVNADVWFLALLEALVNAWLLAVLMPIAL